MKLNSISDKENIEVQDKARVVERMFGSRCVYSRVPFVNIRQFYVANDKKFMHTLPTLQNIMVIKLWIAE